MCGWGLFNDKEVCVSVCGVSSDLSPKVAYAVLPVEIHLPIKEGSCTYPVLLESG
jgi:hypothetical protein